MTIHSISKAATHMCTVACTLAAVSSATLASTVSVASTAQEIDQKIDADDRAEIAGANKIDFSNQSYTPAYSSCSLRMTVSNLDAILENPSVRDRHLRVARLECLKGIDFSMNVTAQIRTDDDVELARDAFTCAVTGTHKGVPSETREHVEGMAGVVVRQRLLLPNSVTEFDNRKVVQTQTPGRSAEIEVQCRIHPNPKDRQLAVREFRQQWLLAKEEERQRQAALAIEIERQQLENHREQTRVARNQLVELQSVQARSAVLGKKYDQCLERYRIADRLYREYVRVEGNSLAASCKEKNDELQKWIAVASDRIQAADRLQIGVVVSEQERLLKRETEKSCQAKLDLCLDPSIMGQISEAADAFIRSRR